VHASPAGEVLHDHGRIAGKMPRHVAREGASVEIITAAGAVADDDIHGLASIELGDRVGLRAGWLWRGQAGRDSEHTPGHQGFHYAVPHLLAKSCNARRAASTCAANAPCGA